MKLVSLTILARLVKVYTIPSIDLLASCASQSKVNIVQMSLRHFLFGACCVFVIMSFTRHPKNASISRLSQTTLSASPVPFAPALAKKVKFSFIYASRNDNYMGRPLERLRSSLTALHTALDEFNLTDVTEIIIIDWCGLLTRRPCRHLWKKCFTPHLRKKSSVLFSSLITTTLSEV